MYLDKSLKCDILDKKTKYSLNTVIVRERKLQMKTMKVSSQSKPHSVATSISETIKAEGAVEVISIGAASLNEATKAIIYAKGNLATAGLSMCCVPSFIDVEIDGASNNDKPKIKTAIKWVIRGTPE